MNGDDSTGDGSASKPYKTIQKASTGLTGDDEVRCAKSPAPTALSGTLTFTDGSTSVATSVDLTGVLAAKDFVSLNSTGEHSGETWWEISSITSTTITLTTKYSGTGGTGTGYKLGVTDTDAAAASSTVVQQISASGSSGHLLKVSGGWNLSGTPTQDGYTWFFQSGANRYGYGLQLSSKSYIDLDFGRVGFLRYSRAIYLSSSSNNTITSATCNSNSYGIYLSGSSNNTITSATCNSNSTGIYLSGSNNTITSATCNSNSTGIYLYSGSNNNTITSATCNSNSTGIYLSSSSNNTITSPTCNSNSTGINLSNSSNNNTITSATCNSNSYGIYLSGSNNNTITSPTCNNNSDTGICLNSSNNNTITSPTCNSNGYGIYLTTGSSCVVWNYAHDESTWSNAGKIYEWAGNKQKLVSIGESESGGAARSRVYFYGGYTQDNTAEADGGTGKCLQFNPKSATYWIEQDFNVPVTSGVARTISIKMKDDASFDGSVELELWLNGVLIVGPTTKTMTTSYVAQTMTAAAGDIDADGVLVLKVKVYGTTGCVYADTLSYT